MYLKIESALSMCAKLALAKRKARTGPVELFGRLILANPPRGSDSVVAPARVARVEAVRGVVVAVAVDGRALAARPRQDVVDVREVVLGRVLRRPRLTGGWRAGGRRRGALLRKSIQGCMITALRRAFPQGFELYRPQVSSTHP